MDWSRVGLGLWLALTGALVALVGSLVMLARLTRHERDARRARVATRLLRSLEASKQRLSGD